MERTKEAEAIALQLFVTGTLVGCLMRNQDYLDVDVKPMFDDEDNYKPSFRIKGNKSGVQLKVTVEIESGTRT